MRAPHLILDCLDMLPDRLSGPILDVSYGLEPLCHKLTIISCSATTVPIRSESHCSKLC